MSIHGTTAALCCTVVWKRKLNGMTLYPATAATSAALSCLKRLSGLLMKLSFWNGPDYYKLKTSVTIYVGQWAWSQAAACLIFCLLTQGHRPQRVHAGWSIFKAPAANYCHACNIMHHSNLTFWTVFIWTSFSLLYKGRLVEIIGGQLGRYVAQRIEKLTSSPYVASLTVSWRVVMIRSCHNAPDLSSLRLCVSVCGVWMG